VYTFRGLGPWGEEQLLAIKLMCACLDLKRLPQTLPVKNIELLKKKRAQNKKGRTLGHSSSKGLG